MPQDYDEQAYSNYHAPIVQTPGDIDQEPVWQLFHIALNIQLAILYLACWKTVRWTRSTPSLSLLDGSMAFVVIVGE
jgi:hypothetical protein